MKAHNWILRAGKHARSSPAVRLAEAIRADSPAHTASAMLILALVVGGGTATAAATASHNFAEASAAPTRSAHAIANPWAF